MRILVDLHGAQQGDERALILVQALAQTPGAHEVHVALRDGVDLGVMPLREQLGSVIGADAIHCWAPPHAPRGQAKLSPALQRQTCVMRAGALAAQQPDVIVLTGPDDDTLGILAQLKTLAPQIPVATLMTPQTMAEQRDAPKADLVFALGGVSGEQMPANCLALGMNGSAEEIAQTMLQGLGTLDRPAAEFDAKDATLDALAQLRPADAQRPALARALAFNFPTRPRTRRLFADVSGLNTFDARTGCQRVARSVLMAWLRSAPEGAEVVPVYATDDLLGYREANAYRAKLEGSTSNIPDRVIEPAPGDAFVGLDLVTELSVTQQPYLMELRRRGIFTRFLLHDLLPVQMPEVFTKGADRIFDSWLHMLLHTDGVIGVSQTTINAFKNWQQAQGVRAVAPYDYHVMHLGADIANSVPTQGMPDDAQTVLTALNARPSFLMVGTIEPRKGHDQVLCAFEALWANGVDANLVLVGKQGWADETLIAKLRNHPQMGQRFFWLEGISDEYLGHVYAATTCLIAASRGEGFGLPLIEAAQAKLPILARDLEVFREVAGEHASYFHADDPEGLADEICAWLVQNAAGKAPQSHGMPWRSWADAAQQLGEIVMRPPQP